MWARRPNPNGGATSVPVTNYNISFGDNYAVFPLQVPIPGKPLPRRQARCGAPDRLERLLGYDGRHLAAPAGGCRGWDARLLRLPVGKAPVGIAAITDGTSNTVLVGEGLPAQDANNEIWTATGASRA